MIFDYITYWILCNVRAKMAFSAKMNRENTWTVSGCLPGRFHYFLYEKRMESCLLLHFADLFCRYPLAEPLIDILWTVLITGCRFWFLNFKCRWPMFWLKNKENLQRLYHYVPGILPI